jgi:branched-chain amino acid transport system substrate-binding protein
MERVLRGAVIVFFVSLFMIPGSASSQAPTKASTTIYSYTIPEYDDVTGPYSELSKFVLPTFQIVYDWWNENVGKKIGVKLVRKIYDTRYDAAETASIHARVVPTDKPIAIITTGGPMIVPIIEKIQEQKIVAINAVPGYSFLHRPAGWAFCPLRAYAQLHAAYVVWMVKEWKEPRKPRIIYDVFEGIAGKDMAATASPWFRANPNIEYLFGEAMFHPASPVDLSVHVRKVMEKKPDFILCVPTSVSATAYYSALRELGYLHKVTLVQPPYQGLDILAGMMGDEMVEGDREVNSANFAPGTKAEEIFNANIGKLSTISKWGGSTSQYQICVWILARAVERAAKKVGPGNITSQAIYDVLNEGRFSREELMGLAEIKFTPKDRIMGVTTTNIYERIKGKTVRVGEVETPYIAPWAAK